MSALNTAHCLLLSQLKYFFFHFEDLLPVSKLISQIKCGRNYGTWSTNKISYYVIGLIKDLQLSDAYVYEIEERAIDGYS